MPVITVVQTLEVIECAPCHLLIGGTGQFQNDRRWDRKGFYCPEGHSQGYTSGEKAKLEQQLKDERGRTKNIEARLQVVTNDLLDKAKELQRVKVRVQKGVCPECRRSFLNLKRHMETKHPTGERR